MVELVKSEAPGVGSLSSFCPEEKPDEAEGAKKTT